METGFKTNDISLTAFLLTQGINLLDVVEESKFRFSFLLSDPDKCGLLRKHYLNNALAPVQELFSKREMLISEIKQMSRG